MVFIANFIRFPAVQCKNFENRLRYDKVRDSLKTGRFLRHSVDRYILTNHGICQVFKFGYFCIHSIPFPIRAKFDTRRSWVHSYMPNVAPMGKGGQYRSPRTWKFSKYHGVFGL